MHELALAEGIIQLLEEQATEQHFQCVRQVWLEIGALACVEEHALRFGLQTVTRNSVAENAVFHIQHKPATGWCLACSQPFERQDYYPQCPHCASSQVQIDGDSGMRVTELEVE